MITDPKTLERNVHFVIKCFLNPQLLDKGFGYRSLEEKFSDAA